MATIMPTVSVAIVTYNHERFIAAALEGALTQRTSFDFEVVVGEDCSTDRTRSIIAEFKERYPDRLKVILNSRNLGMHENGAQVFRACQGEFVAMLDGDDQWTSCDKLQKQVDFFREHPDCSICFHDARVVYADGSHEPHDYCRDVKKEFPPIEDLLAGNFIPTCSVMFPRQVIGNVPEWVKSLPMGDWAIYIFAALQGKIGYIDQVMGVYNIHPGGAWHAMRCDRKEWYRADIRFYENLYHHLPLKQKTFLAALISQKYLALTEEHLQAGETKDAKTTAAAALRRWNRWEPGSAKILLKLYAPRLASALGEARRTLRQLLQHPRLAPAPAPRGGARGNSTLGKG